MLRRMPRAALFHRQQPPRQPDEVDLLVAAVRYEAHQRRALWHLLGATARNACGRATACRYTCNPTTISACRPIPAAPLIMVGPGTGVAPFRAFLEDREETGAAGKTWLFFGDRRFRTDFLYQTDWLRWLKLRRVDAHGRGLFPRRGQKVYVQHRMAQQGRELFAWLEEGAYFYVCGDASDMAAERPCRPGGHRPAATAARARGRPAVRLPACSSRAVTSGTFIRVSWWP